jgi:hypothetical protein
MEILVEAGAQSHGKNDDPGKAQDRAGRSTDTGEPLGRSSLGEMNAAGGQCELLSLSAALAAARADGVQPK